MKIYFFEAEPATGFVRAGYTVEGKRYLSLVMSQDGRLYVTTGARITNDLCFHWFSDAQTAAYQSFCKGSRYSVEYKEAIA